MRTKNIARKESGLLRVSLQYQIHDRLNNFIHKPHNQCKVAAEQHHTKVSADDVKLEGHVGGEAGMRMTRCHG